MTTVSGQTASGSLRKHSLRVLRGSLDVAVEHGVIDRNPASGIAVFKSDSRAGRALTMTELIRLLEALPAEHDVVLTLALTDLRWSELAGLQAGDYVGGQSPHLLVRRRLTLDSEGHVAVLNGTKAGPTVTRKVPVLPTLVPIFAQ